MISRYAFVSLQYCVRTIYTIILIVGAFALPENGWANPTHGADTPKPLGAEAPLKENVNGGHGDSQQLIELTMEEGDTLSGLLGRPSLRIINREAVLRAFSDVHDPQLLHPGDTIRLVLEQQDRGALVRSLHLETGQAEDLTVDIMANSLSSERGLSNQARLLVHQASGIVGPNFRAALQRVPLPESLIEEVLIAFNYDPYMPSPPSAVSRFSIVYETISSARPIVEPKLKYVALRDGRKTHRVYRYHTDDGRPAYVREGGRGVALVDLAKPIDVVRVTSPYGWRIHPVFGDRRFHKGVDYGAPLGTPVIAAADGQVADVGWRGNYGRYIRLDHGTGIATAYAHMSRFARGITSGKQVRKGQVIGYVGETGVATGPHLYYEVMLNGTRIDPLNIPETVPIQLEGRSFDKFRQYVQDTRHEPTSFR